MSVFKACLEHAFVDRPPADECFSDVPGHGEVNADLAGLVTTRNVATPENVSNKTLPENVANFVGGYIFGYESRA